MRLRFNQAIAKAIHDEMVADDTVFVLGEDVGVAGGVFKTTEGLFDTFGPGRIRDTPISEMGFLGAAVGAAATGLRPVVEIMFAEFLGVALDQLVTEAAKFRYLSAGRVTVPLTVRSSCGAGGGFGAQHSQTLEHWALATPGLKVVVPSSPQSAYGLLRAAIQDPDPVLVLEPRILYGERGDVNVGDDHVAPIGVARAIQHGTDLTIVALGAMVRVAERAAETIGGGRVEVIDLQTLAPWDRHTVFDSVGRTRRLVVVEESPWSSGWGTEIAAAVSSMLFGRLAAPVARVTCPDVPVPYAAELEARFVPSVDEVVYQATAVLDDVLAPPWWVREGWVRDEVADAVA